MLGTIQARCATAFRSSTVPEGPEVRMCRDLLAETIDGEVLTEVRLVSGKLARNGIGNLELLDLPQQIVRVDVRGKLILIYLKNNAVIRSTLGMSGWWYPHIDQVSEDVKRRGKARYNEQTVNVGEVLDKAFKHVRIELVCESGKRACYIDPRNFGNIEALGPGGYGASPFEHIGFDLLNDLPMWRDDKSALERKLLEVRKAATTSQLNMKLGHLCLEQGYIAGLGNIYRAETLYLCSLNPNKRLKELTDGEFCNLLVVGSYVLNLAYNYGGSMSYSYDFLQHVQPDLPMVERMANEQVPAINRHLVYARSHDPNGFPVMADKSFGRTMWWCPEVQQ